MRCQEKVLNSREFGAGGFARWWTQITIERQIIQKGAKWAYRRPLARNPSAVRATPWRSYLRLLRKGLAKPSCCHDAGSLLHHRFSFSLTRRGGQRESSFLRRFPSGHPAWPLASFLPYGARTFLMACGKPPAPRSSGPLRRRDSSTMAPVVVQRNYNDGVSCTRYVCTRGAAPGGGRLHGDL